MKSRGIRITEIFFSAKTLKKGNQACVSRATPIFYIHCYKQFFLAEVTEWLWFKECAGSSPALCQNCLSAVIRCLYY